MGSAATASGILCLALLAGAFGLLAEVPDANKLQFEAAFQGKCGRGSPCEQLCYELHDGMYECDCRAGFELNQDGYSCYEMNTTMSPLSPIFGDNAEDIIYQKDASITAELESNDTVDSSTTQQSPDLEQKVPTNGDSLRITEAMAITAKPCLKDCGNGGACAFDISDPSQEEFCLCPLGQTGDSCEKGNADIVTPRFTGNSWVAFPPLRSAYKHVRVSLELRPEAYDGIFFLTGERDDMQGDFMALLLHQGFVEFRFDCGSGVGVVRSEETVFLNQWNRITLYRHRWDAWLQLNDGKKVQGRSKGLFSRITFREPLFVGGSGNTTGLRVKLPVSSGLRGCVRDLRVNEHRYRSALQPAGDALKGFGIQECSADRCSRTPCQHGGECLTGPDSAVCLCPLGFSGDLCETRVDLQVAAFNGSSHLRYRGLADTALTWLELELTIRPTTYDGLLLHNSLRTDGVGDFIALYMHQGFVEFAFDLGSGTDIVRSDKPLSLGEWHQIRVSRTGRLAILQVDNQLPAEILSSGAFTQLSLPQDLYLGGVPNFSSVSPEVKMRKSFVGCIQKVSINGRQMNILAEALGGANVDNCPHPCVAKPCEKGSVCVPDMDYFTCRCNDGTSSCSLGKLSPSNLRGSSETAPIPGFSGKDSYLHYSDIRTLNIIRSFPLEVNIRFKTSSEDGLLLWFGLAEGDEDRRFLSLGVEGGALVMRYDADPDEMVVVYNLTRVSDNHWHRVKATRRSSGGLLVVDRGPAVTTQLLESLRPHMASPGLYVGGMPQVKVSSGGRYRSGVRGCVSDLELNLDYNIRLISMSALGRNVARCDS